MKSLPYKKYCVLGLGPTGLSCVRYLSQFDVDITAMDSRDDPPELAKIQADFPKVNCHAGSINQAMIDAADCLVFSPGVDPNLPEFAKAIKAGKAYCGDVQLFLDVNTKPIVAITGSNGKSTVTTLVGEMVENSGFSVGIGGNIGKQCLDFLDEPEKDFYVLELSSFQLETIHHLNAKTAVLLNCSPDHLDRHPSADEYLKIKQKVYDGAEISVLNLDHQELWEDAKLGIKRLSFGLDSELNQGSFHIMQDEGQPFFAFDSAPLMRVCNMRLQGPQHELNAMAALALGDAIGLPMEEMTEVLRSFSGLPHRCQQVKVVNEVKWFNDSKGTNVGACIVALTCVAGETPGKIILIAGGQAKGQDFSSLCESIKQQVSHVILMGEDRLQLKDAFEGIVDITCVDSMAEAVAAAKKQSKAEDSVLLSPACASFDMFSGFVERGEAFVKLVEKL